MPRKSYRFKPSEDEEKFETEALSFLNNDETQKQNKHKKDFDSESEPELSGTDESDVEEKLLLENDEEGEAGNSDDEAPESVGFHDSKKAVLAQFRSAMKQIDEEREKKKEHRQKLEQQFKEQKAKKLEKLSKSKLPEEFLEELDEEIPKKKKKKEKSKKKKKEEKEAQDLDNDLDDLQDDPIDDLDTTPHTDGTFGEDFISLTDSVSGVEVTEVKSLQKKQQTLAQIAADFRNSRLYGPNIRRESNSKLMAIKEKRRQRSVPGIQSSHSNQKKKRHSKQNNLQGPNNKNIIKSKIK